MTELVQDTAWQADALELRATTDLTPSDIGAQVGKHPATIRKLFARNPGPDPEPTVDRAMSAAEASEAFDGPIPGQTTVDDHLRSEEPPPEDDPEFEPEYPRQTDAAITALIREAGEATGPLQTRPGEENPDPLDEAPAQPVLYGAPQMVMDFGPNAAPVTSATITFKGTFPSGHYGPGDVIRIEGYARITDIKGGEKLDKDIEDWVAKPTGYVATVTEFEVTG